MWRVSARRKLRAMDEATVCIRLELALTDDVPGGVVSVDGGAATRFQGWLGLMTAIETLTAEIKEDTHADH